VIGVNTNGYQPEKLKAVMTKEKLTWRSFADVSGSEGEADAVRPIVEQWNLQGTPTLYLLDHRGVIRYRWIGSPGTKAIDLAVQSLIKDAEEDAKKGTK
jgi:hypothetical protein